MLAGTIYGQGSAPEKLSRSPAPTVEKTPAEKPKEVKVKPEKSPEEKAKETKSDVK